MRRIIGVVCTALLVCGFFGLVAALALNGYYDAAVALGVASSVVVLIVGAIWGLDR